MKIIISIMVLCFSAISFAKSETPKTCRTTLNMSSSIQSLTIFSDLKYEFTIINSKNDTPEAIAENMLITQLKKDIISFLIRQNIKADLKNYFKVLFTTSESNLESIDSITIIVPLLSEGNLSFTFFPKTEQNKDFSRTLFSCKL